MNFRRVKLVAFLAMILVLFSCFDKILDDLDGNQNEDDSPTVNEDKQGEVYFSLERLSSTGQSVNLSSGDTQTATKIALKYRKKNDTTEFSVKIPLTNLLTLDIGDYEITRFELLNATGLTIFAVPKSESFVDKTLKIPSSLPYKFKVNEGENQLALKVVEVESDTDPQDFGFADFTYEGSLVVFYIEAKILNDNGVWTGTSANFKEESSADTILIKPKATKILLEEQENYTITVSKAGYDSKNFAKTKSELQAYNSTPWEIKLMKNSDPLSKENLVSAIANGENVAGANVSQISDMSGLMQAVADALGEELSSCSIVQNFNQDISGWDVSGATNMSGMFEGASSFNQDLSDWTTSQVTNMSGMFKNAANFNQDLDGWNVGNVTDMSQMFEGAKKFNGNIRDWQVGKVTNMSGMFKDASAFNQNIGGWTTNNVTNMSQMFAGASAFDQDISGWNVSQISDHSDFASGHSPSWTLDEKPKFDNYALSREDLALLIASGRDVTSANISQITDMSGLMSIVTDFSNADTVQNFNQDISDWNVENVTNMSGMFEGASSFNQDLSGWTTSQVTNMSRMFKGASAFNQDIGGWSVSSVGDMSGIFQDAANFAQDLSSWSVGNVSYMSRMFAGATSFNANISGWTTSSATNMSGMFENASAFNQDISGWDIEKVTDMSQMFAGATSFAQNLSGWNTETVTNFFKFADGSSPEWTIAQKPKFHLNRHKLAQMIANGEDVTYVSLAYIDYLPDLMQDVARISGTDSPENCPAVQNFNQDISGWDVSNIKNMSGMFEGASSFNRDISGWTTSQVTDMSRMFKGASSFNQNIGGWNVDSVVNMSGMFEDASLFNQDISGWKTSRVANMSSMFARASAFDQNISGWNIDKVTEFNDFDSNSNASWLADEKPQFPIGKQQLAQMIANDEDVSNVKLTGDFSYLMEAVASLSSQSVVQNFNQDISGWNVEKVSKMTEMFQGASSLNQDISGWDVSSVSDMSGMFSGASNFDQDLSGWVIDSVKNYDNFDTASSTNWTILEKPNLKNLPLRKADLVLLISKGKDVTKVNVSQITDMSNLMQAVADSLGENLSSCSIVKNFDQDIRGWNVENVTDMSGMFKGASGFDKDLSGWSVGNVTAIDEFDAGTSSQWTILEKPALAGYPLTKENLVLLIANQRDVSSANVSQITDMSNLMTQVASALDYDNPKECPVVQSFNQDISQWDVSRVKDMHHMFQNATSFNQNIGGWSVDSVTNMSYMFDNAESFNQNIGGWDVSQVTNMNGMFSLADNFNGNVGLWGAKTGKVREMSGMFLEAGKFNQDISSWDVSQVYNMSEMFYKATAFNQNISDWNVGKAYFMQYMFGDAENFNQDIGSWNVSTVRRMDGMFKGAAKFNGDIGDWNAKTGNVYTMDSMFEGAIAFNQDISDWDVSDVTTMASMFKNATSFSKYIGDWDVDSVTNMNSMFYGATAFDDNIKDWEVDRVEDMRAMFYSASNFGRDLSRWNVGAVTDFNFFDSGTKDSWLASEKPSFPINTKHALARQIALGKDVTNLDVSSITDLSDLMQEVADYLQEDIDDCQTVKDFNQNISNWNIANVTKMDSMLYNAISFNQDLSGWDIGKVTKSQDYALNASKWEFSNRPNLPVSKSDLVLMIAAGNDVTNVDVSQITDMSNLMDLVASRSSQSVKSFNQNISGWDVSGVTNMSRMFAGANSFNQPIGSWNVANVTDMSYMFESDTIFDQPLGGWNVSGVTNMKGMFAGAKKFNGNIGNWGQKTSQVTDMSHMFDGAESFNQAIGTWNLQSVKNLSAMFRNAKSFNQDINANTSNNTWNFNATDMSYMFEGATAFDRPIGDWNTGLVTDMSYMFRETNFNQDISDWDIDQVTDLTMMFADNTVFDQDLTAWSSDALTAFTQRGEIKQFGGFCSWDHNYEWKLSEMPKFPVTLDKLIELIADNVDVALADVQFITDMSFLMSKVTQKYNEIHGTTYSADDCPPVFNFNQEIGEWNVSNVTDMESMFYKARAFNQDISGWDVANVRNMRYMFGGASSFNREIGNWKNVAPINTSGMFSEATKFNQDIGSWNMAYVTDMNRMFAGATAFNNGGSSSIGGWNTANAINMERTFVGAYNFDQDISRWNVDKIQNFDYFASEENTNWTALERPKFPISKQELVAKIVAGMDLAGLKLAGDMSGLMQAVADAKGETILSCQTVQNFNDPDVISWDVSNVTNMDGMFAYAKSFNQPLNGWNVGNVTSMSQMFAGAQSFNQNLDSWNVSKVTNMRAMFNGAYNFNGDVPSWDVSKVTSMGYMFKGTPFNGYIGNWDVSSVTDMEYMFDEARKFDQDITRWNVSSVTTARSMFHGASSFRQNLINWDISQDANLADFDYITRSDWGVQEKPRALVPPITFDELIKKIAKGEDVRYVNTSQITSLRNLIPDAQEYWEDHPTECEGVSSPNSSFNQDISYWDVSNVTDMTYTFYHAEVFNQNINNWDVGNVKKMASTFCDAYEFNQPLDKWDMGSVTTIYGMFWGAFRFNQPINSWKFNTRYNETRNKDDWFDRMDSAFRRAFSFNQNINDWDVQHVTKMSTVFLRAYAFNQPLDKWNVSELKRARAMFYKAKSFNQPLDNWDVTNVDDMFCMFQGAQSFNQPLNTWTAKLVSVGGNYSWYQENTPAWQENYKPRFSADPADFDPYLEFQKYEDYVPDPDWLPNYDQN